MHSITFSRDLIQQLKKLATASPRVEICGLVSAIDNSPCRVYPIDNVADNPGCNFLLDAKQQIEAMREMRASNEELFAIYHSHPDGSITPSGKDIEQANYPAALNLIIGTSTDGVTDIAGYFIEQHNVLPVKLLTR